MRPIEGADCSTRVSSAALTGIATLYETPTVPWSQSLEGNFNGSVPQARDPRTYRSRVPEGRTARQREDLERRGDHRRSQGRSGLQDHFGSDLGRNAEIHRGG